MEMRYFLKFRKFSPKNPWNSNLIHHEKNAKTAHRIPVWNSLGSPKKIREEYQLEFSLLKNAFKIPEGILSEFQEKFSQNANDNSPKIQFPKLKR